ncbi:MAG TPA: pantoate--beta-alanine ligase [Nitriliruptorales bacterium]
MRTVTTIAELRAAVAAARADGHRIGLVPTMGALHAGHLSLVARCAAEAGFVVVSIFVNPTQFGPDEDLDGYPRDLDRDRALLAGLERPPDLVFAPSVEAMYPQPLATTVHVRGLTDVLCGRSRPGHFDGVTTVVSKLFGQAQPDVAVFGRKDFQQLAVLRRMAADLDLPVEILGAPIVREADGLAMSSRNHYLDRTQRQQALALSRALRAAVEAHRNGVSTPAAIERAVSSILEDAPGVAIDYVEVRDPATLGDVIDGQQQLVAVAAHVGPARLIDNVVLGHESDENALMAATAPTPQPAP